MNLQKTQIHTIWKLLHYLLLSPIGFTIDQLLA